MGIVTYILFFSKTIVKISVSIILFIKKIVSSILKTILYPLKLIINFLKKVLAVPYSFSCKTKDKLKECCKKMSHKQKIKSKNHKILENKEGF